MIDEQTLRTLRGYYTWGGGDDIPAPATLRAKLRYKRFTMRELWPERGRFDFAPLQAEFDRAARNGQRYALRLRAMTGEGIAVPDWVRDAGLTVESTTLDTKKPITIPKHADSAWLELMREFVSRVAEWCAANRPGMVAFVDIGMLGRWGEGHFWGIKGDGTVDGTRFWMPPIAAQRAIVDAHVAAFGAQARLVALTGPKDMLRYALLEAKAPQPIGWRRDSLGNDSFDDIAKDSQVATLLRERAKIAPVITEFWNGTGDDFAPTRALEQVKRWGVWLVGNGNLGKTWDDYDQAEQDAFIAIGEQLGAPLQVAPPTIEQQLAALSLQVAELATKQAVTEQELVALKGRRLVAETTIREMPATSATS